MERSLVCVYQPLYWSDPIGIDAVRGFSSSRIRCQPIDAPCSTHKLLVCSVRGSFSFGALAVCLATFYVGSQTRCLLTLTNERLIQHTNENLRHHTQHQPWRTMSLRCAHSAASQLTITTIEAAVKPLSTLAKQHHIVSEPWLTLHPVADMLHPLIPLHFDAIRIPSS